MASIQIDSLAPGMVLKQKVTDRSGRMLLPEGATLEAKHFAIFRMWGVLDVEVVDGCEPEPVEQPLEDEVDPGLQAQASVEVNRIFANNDPNHPAIRELMRLCVRRMVLNEA